MPHSIKLCSSIYEVRVRDGIREVLFPPTGGNWITHDKFVDALADRGAWDQVCELAKLGRNVLENDKDET